MLESCPRCISLRRTLGSICAATVLHAATTVALTRTVHDPCPAIHRLLERRNVGSFNILASSELDQLLNECLQTHSSDECNKVQVVSSLHKRCSLDRAGSLDLAIIGAARGTQPVDIRTSGTGWGPFGDGIRMPGLKTGTSFRGPSAPPLTSNMDRGVQKKRIGPIFDWERADGSESVGTLERGADALHALNAAGVGKVEEPKVPNSMPSFVPLVSGGASRSSTIGEANAVDGLLIAAARENPASTDRAEDVEAAIAEGLLNATMTTPAPVVMSIVAPAPGVQQAIEAGINAGLVALSGGGQGEGAPSAEDALSGGDQGEGAPSAEGDSGMCNPEDIGKVAAQIAMEAWNDQQAGTLPSAEKLSEIAADAAKSAAASQGCTALEVTQAIGASTSAAAEELAKATLGQTGMGDVIGSFGR